MTGARHGVKLVMSVWIDYLHIGKVGDRWVIINVLREMKPEKAQQAGPQGGVTAPRVLR